MPSPSFVAQFTAGDNDPEGGLLHPPYGSNESMEARVQGGWSSGDQAQPTRSQRLAELHAMQFMVAPEEPPVPEAPPVQEVEMPEAPDLPEAPPPPEVKVESESVAGWPQWLVEEVEARVAEELVRKPPQRNDEEARGPENHDLGVGSCDLDHTPTVGEYTTTCASDRMAKCPLACAISILILVLAPIAVGIVGFPYLNVERLPLTIETTFDSFLQTDVPAAIALRSFDQALAEKPSSGRRLAGTYSALQDLVLYYELEEDHGLGGGLLANHVILAISRFEARLRALPGWMALCDSALVGNRGLCNPGVSLASYVRATWQLDSADAVEPQALRFDGGGRDPLNLPTALHFLDSHGLIPVVLPSDTNSTSDDVPEPRLLRSVFRFKIYCCDLDSSSTALRRKFNERTDAVWRDFIVNEVIPLLSEGPGAGVHVSFDGTQVDMIEVTMALMNDVRYALGSMIFVHLYLLFHTRSIMLSLVGPLLSALALPLSFTVCGYVFGATTVNFASALALFLTVGFGADVILVFTDFWRSSGKLAGATDSQRLAWTFKHAGGASFATTATTALSFFANLASAIRALRQFAFLMGLCVVFAWILILAIYTPLCMVNERFIQCLCPAKVTRQLSTGSTNSRILARRVKTLRSCRYMLLFLSLAALCTFVLSTMVQVKFGTALPRIFPEEHNRVRVDALITQFRPLSVVFRPTLQAPQLQEQICSKDAAAGSGSPSCGVHWCVAGRRSQAVGQSTDASAIGCSCWRGRLSSTTCSNSAALVTGVTRLVGVGELSPEQLNRVVAGGIQPASAGSLAQSTRTGLTPLVLQDWLSGSAELRPFSEVTGLYRRAAASPAPTATSSEDCDWQDLCFCSNASYVCELPSSWTRISDFELPAPVVTPRLLLPAATIPLEMLTTVRVGFGLDIKDSVPMLGDQGAAESWDYMHDFVASDPWVQRMMLKFCDELPLELAVVQKWCWIEDFRDWLRTRNERFPTQAHDFDELGLEFADTASRASFKTAGREFIWVERNALKAFYFTFKVDLRWDSRASVALEYRSYWDAYVKHYEELALAEGRGRFGIFHVSTLWKDAEAESELVRSTLVTIAIVLGLACLGMLVFTRSAFLSLFVVVSTLQTMAGLLFFITTVMGWTIGLIEVVALIYFVGYAVTYPLHVAHKYADPEATFVRSGEEFKSWEALRRYQRTQWALRSIGGAALGSAMTTAGASIFLVFCTLTIFVKLGAMCLVVTLMSILTALGPLPAALLAFGPPKPGICNTVESALGIGDARSGSGILDGFPSRSV